MTGGCFNPQSPALHFIHIYDIENDEWKMGPRMIRGRQSHSSCSEGDYVYVCGGQDSSAYLNSIERFNVTKYVEHGLEQAWQLLELKQGGLGLWSTFSGRCQPLMAPLAESQILILGGRELFGFLSDGFILDTETLSLTRVISGYFNKLMICAPGNNHCTQRGKHWSSVTGLVWQTNCQIHLVEYREGQSEATIL